jgi:hypothetical protein
MAALRKLVTLAGSTGSRLTSTTKTFNNQQTRALSTSPILQNSIISARSKAHSKKLNEFFEFEAPFQGLSAHIGDLAEPLAQQLVSKEMEAGLEGMHDKDRPLYVPKVPVLCPLSKLVRDNDIVREVLVFNQEKDGDIKPRMSWYHPDDTMIPRGWFKEGIMADFQYYYSDVGKTPKL